MVDCVYIEGAYVIIFSEDRFWPSKQCMVPHFIWDVPVCHSTHWGFWSTKGNIPKTCTDVRLFIKGFLVFVFIFQPKHMLWVLKIDCSFVEQTLC